MKERPILFSGQMVRAILEGRKTMTRRVVKPQPLPPVHHWELGKEGWWSARGLNKQVEEQFVSTWPWSIHCPYGQPGARLWVRETWAAGACADMLNPSALSRKTWLIDNGGLWYEADGAVPLTPIAPKGKRRPSIHMPRWASRILLDVTAVRVERVQDISEDDSEAEGLEGHNVPTGGDDYQDLWRDYSIKEEDNEGYNYFKNPRDSFRSLWDSINAKRGYGWDANPWVWVVEFKRIEP